MRSALLLVLFISLAGSLKAQSLRGSIKSTDGESIPFASIYIKELTTGTTSNESGIYNIPLAEGEYHIFYQALGYARIELTINIENKDLVQDVILKDQDYQLKEVQVYSGNEDPAYPIMRKSISLASYFQHQIKSYKANVYLKGGFDIDKIPRLLRNQLKEDGIEQGKNYVSESVNEIKFTAPNQYEHIQISKRSTIPDDSEDQVMGFINYSFYDVDNEDFISPLSRKAFSFYKFEYVGFFQQGEYYINKIKVMPKRKNQKLFAGYIFIVDQLWNIHSVDLTNEQFFGTVRVRQVQEQVEARAWLPVSHNFDVDVSLMGFKVKANYGGSVEYSKVELDADIVLPASVKKAYVDMEDEIEEVAPVSKNQQKIEELMQQAELNNRDMLKLTRLMEKEQKGKEESNDNLELEEWGSNYKVLKDTVKRDSLNWDAMRPIPLSKVEVQSFQQKDSLQLTVSKTKTDSTYTKKKSNFNRISSALISGNRFHNKDSALQIDYSGFIHFKAFDFNAVDGFTYMQYLKVNWQVDSTHILTVTPYLKYAFGRNKLQWKLENQYSFAPLHRGTLSLSAGQWTNDFNNDGGINPLLNAVSSLFFKENYLKVYQDDYIKGGFGIDIKNGLRISSNIQYQQFYKLENTNNYSFAYPNTEYRDNNTVETISPIHFNSQSSLSFDAQVSYTPKYYYRVVKGRKRMEYSNYPTFTLAYKGAYAGVLNTDSDFDMFEFRINQKLEWSFLYSLNYDVSAGYFMNNNNVHFSQFKHFNTSEIPISIKQLENTFMLLNDYSYSTNDWYLQAHLNYSTPYLLIKNLWFLQDKLWNENLYLHHLSTETIKQYNEFGYGISNIFLMGSVGVFVAYEQFDYRAWGIRAAITIP